MLKRLKRLKIPNDLQKMGFRGKVNEGAAGCMIRSFTILRLVGIKVKCFFCCCWFLFFFSDMFLFLLFLIFLTFLLFFFLYFTILYWFCHTSTCIHHGCTHFPHLEPPSHLHPHTIPLGHPSVPAPSFLYPALNLAIPGIEPGKGLAIPFLYDIIHVLMPFSQGKVLSITNLLVRRRQWHPTPLLLPGKSHGQRSLVGHSPWGR